MKRVHSSDVAEAGVGFTLQEALQNFVANATPEASEKFSKIVHTTVDDYVASQSASKSLNKMNRTGVFGVITVEH